MKTFTCANLREGSDPVVLVETDDEGEMVREKDKISLISLEYLGKNRNVQINCYGRVRAPSARIVSAEFSEIESIVDEICNDNKAKLQAFDRYEGRKPLVFFDSDNLERYFLASFGRKYNPESRVPIKVDYIGDMNVVEYENRIVLPEGLYERVNQDFSYMKKYLELRNRVQKSNKRERRNRRAA